MNLEDYFDMLQKMAKKNPQSASGSHGVVNDHHQKDSDNLNLEEDEEPLPPDDKGET
jgi:hypothetical protein